VHYHTRKIELFQIIINPPEAPVEGKTTYSSKRLGHHALIKAISKSSFFVSCKQITEQPLLLIEFIRANYLDFPLRPLMFQHSINHILRKFITIRRYTNKTERLKQSLLNCPLPGEKPAVSWVTLLQVAYHTSSQQLLE
jgi:hypothetical protein